MIPLVCRHYRWASVSLPLHYPSVPAPDYRRRGMDEHLMCDLLWSTIEQIYGPQPKVVLVGYSLGGFAALNIAAKHPGAIRAVASIGGFLTGRAKGLERVLQELSKGRLVRRGLFHAAWRILQSHLFFLRLAVRFYAHDTRALLRYPHLDETLRAIFPDVKRHDIEAMRLLFRYLLDMSLTDEIDRIRMPVLVIAGEKDPIIPYRHQRKYALALPDCRFCSLPGTGHVPFAERADEFERVFTSWLSEVCPAENGSDRASSG